MEPPVRRRAVLLIAGAVVALDAATKALAVQFLSGRGSVSVLGGALHLQLFRNFAGPRDTFEGHSVLVSILALAGVAAIAAVSTRVRTRPAVIGLGLLLGGGTGNLLDRLLRAPGPLRGGVVDWLRPPWSGAEMNLADLSITAGVLVIVFATLRLRGRASLATGASPAAVTPRQPPW
jgi:signal peptidase II